jgi:hypothetical protein
MEGARYLEDGAHNFLAKRHLLRTAVYIMVIIRSLRTSSEQGAVDLGRRLLFQLEQRPERAFRQIHNI